MATWKPTHPVKEEVRLGVADDLSEGRANVGLCPRIAYK
jgi:hypothetical protein